MELLTKLKNVFTKTVPDTSGGGKVDSTDLAKVTRNAALVGVAAALSELLKSIDPNTFGVYQPLVILGLTAALDFVGKLVKNNKKPETPV